MNRVMNRVMNIVFSFLLIWEDFVLLLFYGSLSPLIAFMIGLNIYAHTILTRYSICQNYRSKMGMGSSEKGHNPTNDVNNYLEANCVNCHVFVDYMKWPGIALTTIIMSLLLFDMTYDSDDYDEAEDSFGSTVTIICVTLFTVPAASMWWYYEKVLDSSSSGAAQDSGGDNDAEGGLRFGIELKMNNAEGETVKNPMLGWCLNLSRSCEFEI